jgi:hypothetical protein
MKRRAFFAKLLAAGGAAAAAKAVVAGEHDVYFGGGVDCADKAVEPDITTLTLRPRQHNSEIFITSTMKADVALRHDEAVVMSVEMAKTAKELAEEAERRAVSVSRSRSSFFNETTCACHDFIVDLDLTLREIARAAPQKQTSSVPLLNLQNGQPGQIHRERRNEPQAEGAVQGAEEARDGS